MTENKTADTKSNKASAKNSAHKMVKIKLPKTRELRDDVFVSVNNYTYMIQRGVEVEVPMFVKAVLDRKEKMAAQRMAFEEEHQNK